MKGFLVLESGEVYQGLWHGGKPRAGEVVFNTSHAGYEEMATDPSYFSQILVTTAPMQGNYGAERSRWESRQIWIEGFCSLELQNSPAESAWRKTLLDYQVPILTQFDVRSLVLRLRRMGTPWGALVPADNPQQAAGLAKELIAEKRKLDLDWVHFVSRPSTEILVGENSSGPRVAIMDFGCKENTVRELQKRCREVAIFPSRAPVSEIREFEPDGILLSNGPGNPEDVQVASDTIRELLGWRTIFGICMGHQLLARALGAKTYKLKFGHRGGNHPVKDHILNKIYVTSQNHGYAVSTDLPSGVVVTHMNLNDKTVEGIESKQNKCFSVQYHPESCPGPNDARPLFDYFIGQLR